MSFWNLRALVYPLIAQRLRLDLISPVHDPTTRCRCRWIRHSSQCRHRSRDDQHVSATRSYEAKLGISGSLKRGY
jgi:hypothetical protein